MHHNTQWVVQRNLTNQNDLLAIEAACRKMEIGFVGIDIIPFSAELPAFDKKEVSIVYGSTTFNALAFDDNELHKGIFFDESSFSIENYNQKWGEFMLNYGASITTFSKLMETDSYDSETLLFIRPDDDSKSFAGEVKRFDEIENWYQKLIVAENTNLSPNSKIVVSKPYSIKYEWRLWIVRKRVIAASKYREYFRLTKQKGCPDEVVSFAEQRCQEFTPHDVFVMDVALCGHSYYIVECNCMNSAGFYSADIDSIVRNVTEYFNSQLQ